jgi:hypothetical protein
MSNPAIPQIPIDLDKPRNLLFTALSVKKLEEATGLNGLDGTLHRYLFGEVKADKTVVEGKMTAGHLALMVWAGLIHEDPSLTQDAVAALIHPSQFPALFRKVLEAWVAGMPDQAKKGEDEKPPLAASAQV